MSAIVESESEEKERLTNALEEQKKKEEKWRSMVKDLCRQLRELRQQISKRQVRVLMSIVFNQFT